MELEMVGTRLANRAAQPDDDLSRRHALSQKLLHSDRAVHDCALRRHVRYGPHNSPSPHCIPRLGCGETKHQSPTSPSLGAALREKNNPSDGQMGRGEMKARRKGPGPKGRVIARPLRPLALSYRRFVSLANGRGLRAGKITIKVNVLVGLNATSKFAGLHACSLLRKSLKPACTDKLFPFLFFPAREAD